MKYETARLGEIRKSFDQQVERFIAQSYNARKPTIIFIPGSPGSRLNRSRSPHDARCRNYAYDPAWVSLGMIPFPILKKAGAAYDLRIESDGQDACGHFIVPDGTLHLVLNKNLSNRSLLNNYSKAKKVLQREQNYFEFGCDFRRPVDETATWLYYVIQRLTLRVSETHGRSIGNIVLLCHSYGGVIARVFFEFFPEMETQISQLITVGTPFFGSPNHFEYLYKGDPKVNRFYSPHLIASIYASFPGPYPSMYLPLDVFHQYRDTLNIGDFPVKDKASGKPLDPYGDENLQRYPDFVRSASGQRYDHVRKGLAIQRMIARPMPAAIVSKTFHLLSERVAMPSFYHWEEIDGAKFNATGESSPVRPDDSRCPGDGAVHHWSTCLPQIIKDSGPSRIYKCQANTSHYKLMQSDETLQIVQNIVDCNALPSAASSKPLQAKPFAFPLSKFHPAD